MIGVDALRILTDLVLMYTRVIAGAKRSVLWDVPVYQLNLGIFLMSLQKGIIFGQKTHLF